MENNDYEKREELKKIYPNSESWAHKVDHMSSNQVTAVYIRFKSQRKLGK